MADFGEPGFPDLKSLKVPDSADIVVNGQPTPTFLHFLNEIANGFEALRAYTEPDEPEPPPDQVLIQEQYETTGSDLSTNLEIPFDITPPLITEGRQFQQLDFTPLNADSKIIVEWVGTASGEGPVTVALFISGTDEALDATPVYPGGGEAERIILRAVVDSWGLSSKIFRVRFGNHDGSSTVYLGSTVQGVNRLSTTIKSTLSAREYKNP